MSIALSLTLALIAKAPLSIREGTVVGMIIFAPITGFFMRKMRPLLEKMGVIARMEKEEHT